MRILALDLALRTGWALWDGSSRTSGYTDFSVRYAEDQGHTFARFNRWLRKHDPAPEYVVHESTFGNMQNRGAVAIAIGFSTRVQEYCANRQIPLDSVNASRLKKWTTGNGRAKKPEMIEAVVRRFRVESPIWDPLDDNEADAIAILEYARAELVPQEASA